MVLENILKNTGYINFKLIYLINLLFKPVISQQEKRIINRKMFTFNVLAMSLSLVDLGGWMRRV